MEITKIANKVRDALIEEGALDTLASPIDSESKRIPFLHKFPNDCCEHASYLLGGVINKLHPNSSVLLVTGKYKNIEHYWLLIDGLLYDLTIDQFPGISAPLIGANINNQHTTSISTNNIEDSFSLWDQVYKNEWLNFLIKKINQNG